MIIMFVMKFLPTCLPSGLTVAAPDAFGRIPGVSIQPAKLVSPQTATATNNTIADMSIFT